ncbi:MAG: respiratory chain complex I subunit 1 family protein [Rhodoferax sp.]
MSAVANTLVAVHAAAALTMPFVLVGCINRTKSWWTGRKGPGLWQSYHDLRRLLFKRPVLSTTACAMFRLGAYAVLASMLVAMACVPLLGAFAPLSFPNDFVAVAYTLGLGRLLLMASAMDVGSPFQGMGTAREAMLGAFAEPALFLVLGTAAAATGKGSFADLLGHLHATPYYSAVAAPLALALMVLLQTEAARVPVDDPATHLELTMIHEVMVLDHSGPELAAMQYAAGLKLTLYAGLIATLLNPFDPLRQPLQAVAAAIALMLAVAVAQGCIESLTARLCLPAVPRYVWLAAWLAGAAAMAVGVLGAGL